MVKLRVRSRLLIKARVWVRIRASAVKMQFMIISMTAKIVRSLLDSSYTAGLSSACQDLGVFRISIGDYD